jgi:hypothetical protein
MTLDERAALAEQVSGGTAYLVVVHPDGSVMVDRHHPDGGRSGIGYGAELPEAGMVRAALDRFRAGSSYQGRW